MCDVTCYQLYCVHLNTLCAYNEDMQRTWMTTTKMLMQVVQ